MATRDSKGRAMELHISRNGSIVIDKPSAGSSPGRARRSPTSRSPARGSNSRNGYRRGGDIEFDSQLPSSPSSRNVPRLTALRLQQKLVELDQENIALRTQNEALAKRLREADARQAKSGSLNSRLFHEIEKLSEEKARLEDENKRAQVAMGATSRAAMQTLLQKEKVQVQGEERLQAKIAENMRLVKALATARDKQAAATEFAGEERTRADALAKQLKAARERCTELQKKLSAELQARHNLVQSTVQLTNQFESKLVKAEGELLVSAEKAAARRKQAELAEEIQEQRAKLLQDMTQRVRVLEASTGELEAENGDLRRRLTATQDDLAQARESNGSQVRAPFVGAVPVCVCASVGLWVGACAYVYWLDCWIGSGIVGCVAVAA